MLKHLPMVLFIALCGLVTYPYIGAYRAIDGRMFFIAMFGLSALVYYYSKYKVSTFAALTSLFFVYAVIRALCSYVTGYTANEIAYYLAILGIIYFISKLDYKSVWACVLWLALAQMFFTYIAPLNFNMNLDEHLGAWGTFRHSIKYSTYLMAGIVASWKLFIISGNKWRRLLGFIIIIVMCISLVGAYSNMILLLTTLILAYLFIVTFAKDDKVKLGLIGGVIICIIAVGLIFKPEGFEYDADRLNMIKDALKYNTSYIFGNGLSSWVLNCATIGWANVGHPHNEFIKIYYELGAIGLFMFLSLISMLFFYAINNMLVAIGLLAITASVFTNSLFGYPEIAFLWAIFAGLALGRVEYDHN